MRKPVNEMTLAEYEAALRLNWLEDELQTDTIRRAQGSGFLVAHFRPVKQLRRDGTTRYLTPVQADGKGFPDLMMLRDELAVVSELKAKTGLSPEQEAWLDAFRAVKRVETYVWDTKTPVAEIERVLA